MKTICDETRPEIPTTVTVTKIADDPYPTFRFSWNIKGPDWGSPICKKRPLRICSRSYTRRFVRPKDAHVWAELKRRELERKQ